MASGQTQPQNKNIDKAADGARAGFDQAVAQGEQFAGVTKDNVNRIFDASREAAANTRNVLQNNLEALAQQTREAVEHLNRTYGFSGEDSERFAQQSRRNIETVTRCGTVLSQAYQDTSRSWFELGQKQWQRHLDGLGRLARARSVQEFAAIQSELLSDSLQQAVQDGRGIAERSLNAADEAGKAFAGAARQAASQASSKAH